MGAGVSEWLCAVSIAATRCWLRTYTSGLPADMASDRKAEIESDVWDMHHDAETAGLGRALLTMRRLLAGMRDDIGWRTEVAPLNEQLLTRRLIAIGAATIVVGTLWSLAPVVLKGRRELATCAETAREPRDTAELRHEVLRCAGLFFAKRD